MVNCKQREPVKILNEGKKYNMVIVVFGLPGTGKSYLSKMLAPEFNAIYLNTDIVREETGKKGQYDEQSRLDVYTAMSQKMQDHLYENRNCLLDGTFQKKSYREIVLNLAKKTGTRVYFIHMKARDNTVKERLKNSRKHSEADYGVYLNLKSDFDPVEVPHIEIQTDHLDLTHILNNIKNYIHDKR
jgi:predicted kinase